jgi:phage internal scaffolding protein
MTFRKFDSDGNQLGIDKGDHVFEESKTEQSHKSEVDINNIVKRAGASELIAKVNALQDWKYDDVTNNDFQEAMNAIIRARDTFSSVPSEIRKRFDNDPAAFMDFVRNPDNQSELVEMGLATAPVETGPIEVVVTNQPPTTTETPA